MKAGASPDRVARDSVKPKRRGASANSGADNGSGPLFVAAVDGEVPSTAERLLSAAALLFREKGYAQATTRELARRVGIAGPSMYHHFKTKEDILYGLCEESLRRLTESVRAIESSGDTVEHLRRVIIAHVVTMLRDKDMHATMLVEMRALSPERQARVIEGRDAYESVIAQVIDEGRKSGVLRSDVSLRQMTLALLNMLNWTIFWYHDDGQLTVEEIAGGFADMYLNGVRPRAAERPRRVKR